MATLVARPADLLLLFQRGEVTTSDRRESARIFWQSFSNALLTVFEAATVPAVFLLLVGDHGNFGRPFLWLFHSAAVGHYSHFEYLTRHHVERYLRSWLVQFCQHFYRIKLLRIFNDLVRQFRRKSPFSTHGRATKIFGMAPVRNLRRLPSSVYRISSGLKCKSQTNDI